MTDKQENKRSMYIAVTTIMMLAMMTTHAQNINFCNEVFISEYLEGSQNNKAVELYNPSSEPKNLNQYKIKVFPNGGQPQELQLTGTLQPKETGVNMIACAHPQTEKFIRDKCQILSAVLQFSGDDAVGLYKNDTLIDMVGEIGVNPGPTGWQVGGGSTKDHTLVRKYDVRGGTSYWTQSVFEWIVMPKDTSSDLGLHSSVTKDEDRHILSNFQNPFITDAEVDAFAQRNDLILWHKPSDNLPKGSYSWSYVFEIGAAKCNADPASIAATIQVNESAIVKSVSASTTQYQFDACLTVNEMNLDTANPNRLWQIQNTGGVIANGLSGTNNADAEICECWDAGYTGNGVKVAMLDGGGFEFTHEDMLGKFLKGWNFVTSDTLDSTYIDVSTFAHAMMTSGLVAANADNDTGIAGVAFNSRIIPFLLVNPSPTYTVPGVQMAVDFGADVINMSLSGPFNQNLNDEIVLASQTGRGGLGCVVVGSSGNNNNSTSQFYPAAQNEVIGVGASNPDDFRSLNGDGWGCWGAGQGSNFGSFYEVVAPGSNITSADFTGTQGFNSSAAPSGNYHFSCGTSYSAPIVSGICAILLEKNPTWTWDNVRDAIINGSDKVHSADTGGIYDYNFDPLQPDKSFEMGYGRVNCLNSLNFVVGVDENVGNNFNAGINVFYRRSELVINYELKKGEGNAQLKVYDMLGRELKSMTLLNNRNFATLPVKELAKGVYAVGVYSDKSGFISTHKFYKY